MVFVVCVPVAMMLVLFVSRNAMVLLLSVFLLPWFLFLFLAAKMLRPFLSVGNVV